MLKPHNLIAPIEYLDPTILNAIDRDDAKAIKKMKPQNLMAYTGSYLAIAARRDKARAFNAILEAWGIDPETGVIQPGSFVNPHHLLATAGVEKRGKINGTYGRVAGKVFYQTRASRVDPAARKSA